MGKDSAIAWTHHTFNPWWGCTKISDGCKNCYAATLDHRLGGDHFGPGKHRKTFGDKHWNEPLLWDRKAAQAGQRHRVFVASMADVFDSAAPDGARERLWELIRKTPNLDWLVLTKRPENFSAYLPEDWGAGYPNVWLGLTVENQKAADEKMPIWLRTPARVRFLSMEPLLEAVDIVTPYQKAIAISEWGQAFPWQVHPWSIGAYIHWIIVGGESGVKARPMHPDWAWELFVLSRQAGIPFFFKQWGEWLPMTAKVCSPDDFDAGPKGTAKHKTIILERHPGERPVLMERVGTQAAGHIFNGREIMEFPK